MQMPSDDEGAVEARKAEHLELAARPDVDAAPASAWHDIYFEHEALPECNLDDVDLSTLDKAAHEIAVAEGAAVFHGRGDAIAGIASAGNSTSMILSAPTRCAARS